MRYALPLLLCAWAASASSLFACDTPVYRYAMYKWEPRPYELYYFHKGEIDPAVKALHEQVENLSRDNILQTNVQLMEVSLDGENAVEKMHPLVRRVWRSKPDRPTPGYVLVSPMGYEIHDLESIEGEIKTLIDSPARQAAFKQLHEGKAGVMLLLAGKDKDETAKAEAIVKETLANIKAGKIKLYRGPEDSEGPAPAGEQAAEKEAEGEQPEIGFVRVDRDDPQEQWLVRMLLGVEGDLHEFDDPMVFGLFGRGRVLPPYLGAGVTVENLYSCAEFMSGPCSCTVADENPGVDLLTRYDWFTAAADMAEKFGTEEGNEGRFADPDIFPNLVVAPAVDEPAADQATDEGEQLAADEHPDAAGDDELGDEVASDDVALRDDNDAQRVAPRSAPQDDPTAKQAADNSAAKNSDADSDQSRQVALAEPAGAAQSGEVAAPSNDAASDSPMAAGPNWLYGAGVVLAALVVLGGAVFLIGQFLAPR